MKVVISSLHSVGWGSKPAAVFPKSPSKGQSTGSHEGTQGPRLFHGVSVYSQSCPSRVYIHNRTVNICCLTKCSSKPWLRDAPQCAGAPAVAGNSRLVLLTSLDRDRNSSLPCISKCAPLLIEQRLYHYCDTGGE